MPGEFGDCSCPGGGNGRSRIPDAAWKNAERNSGDTSAGVWVDDICDVETPVPVKTMYNRGVKMYDESSDNVLAYDCRLFADAASQAA